MLNILLVDDNPNDRLIVTRELKQAFSDIDIKSVIDAHTLEAAINEGGFDVVITDYQLYWSDGLQVLAAVKHRYPDCPVIMFTDSGSQEIAVAGMKAGLSDYVLKAGYLQRLSVAVQESLEKKKLRQEYSTALEKLRVSEHNLRFALDAGRIIAFNWNIETGEVNGSQNAPNLIGVENVNATSFENIISFVHPEDRDSFINKLQSAVKGEQNYESEYRIIRPDGLIQWLHDKGQVIYNHQGKATHLFGISMDVTKRKQAEFERSEALERERLYLLRLRQLAQASLSINSTLSLEEILQFIANKSWEIIGAHQAAVNYAPDGNWSQGITKVCLSPKYAQWKSYDQRPDGSGIYRIVSQIKHPIRMTQSELEAHPEWRGFGKEAGKHPPMRGWLAAPLTSRDGKNLGIIQLSDKYSGDFTEEDENILLQMSLMASAAIDNAQLYEKSQAANQAKDEFLAILSHELRSPLNAILGWSSLLSKNRLDAATTSQAVNTIERNARLQVQLIEDLLDISRIVRGQVTLNVTNVRLIQPIEAAIDTMRLAIQTKSIDFQFSMANFGLEDKLIVAGDGARLQQIFWNLLSNAIKFTPSSGKVKVIIEKIEEIDNSSKNFPYSATFAQITVSDTGKGISPEFLPYVFDYFRQSDTSVTRQYGGLGLGLAIVRHLVELHGGTVTAESSGENQGAMFKVKLPLLQIEESLSKSSPNDLAVFLAGVRVLIVDDLRDNLDFLTFLLEQYGAISMAIDTPTEVLPALSTFKPDILICDIGMPQEDGYSLLRRIRKLAPEEGGRVPAIALTAYAKDEDREESQKAGYQRHIAKPVDAEDLLLVIASLL